MADLDHSTSTDIVLDSEGNPHFQCLNDVLAYFMFLRFFFFFINIRAIYIYIFLTLPTACYYPVFYVFSLTPICFLYLIFVGSFANLLFFVSLIFLNNSDSRIWNHKLLWQGS
jgi:hypothetical protein